MARQQVRGVMIIPEKFKLLSTQLTHMATRYKVYADRAKNVLLLDVILTGTKKDSYTYYDDYLYDDQVLYFTTNMQLSDDSWTGESPLTRVVLRREQVSSTGIIVTPSVSIHKMGLPGGFNINASDYIRYEGASAHDSTTYRIEDEITGEVVFEKEDDKNNLLTIKTPENILKPNRVYRISVRFKDVVGRYSNYGSMLYNYSNLLYNMFPLESMTTMYGSNIILENNAKDRIVSDIVTVEGFIDGELVYTGQMINNKIIVNTKQFSVGDILELKLSMNDSVRYITVYITKLNTDVKYDSTFALNNVFENVSLDLDTIIDNNGTTKQEFKDGYIYDYTMDNQLVRYQYDDVNKKLTNYTILRQYDNTLVNNYRRVIENPLDGNIIIIILDTYNSSTHNILILDINTYDIVSLIPLANGIWSSIWAQQPVIIDNILYLHNYSDVISPSVTKTIHTLNLTNYNLEVKGVISFDGITINPAGNITAEGFVGVLFKGEIYFINNGGGSYTGNTISKSVYKLNRNTLTLESVGVLDIDIGIPSGNGASILTTLKNGKPVLIYSKCAITVLSSPVRTITGIYYIDLDTMTVDTTNMITGTAHTTTYGNNVLLNDGTFLFFNSTECVHFK